MHGLLKLSLLCLAVSGAGFVQGCASAGHLAEHDFRGRNVASVNLAPPRPQIFSEGSWSWEGRDLSTQLIRVGAEIAREVSVDDARERLEDAAETVDVATLMADRVLQEGARLLRAQPVTTIQEADFEIETRIERYGIQANSWDAQASFFIDAKVALFESASGRRIWDADVRATDPIDPSVWEAGGDLKNVITAMALARLSVEEMQLALEALAEYSAQAVVDALAQALERAGKR